jgi:hypothetical protein
MEPLRALATQAPPSVPRQFFFGWIHLNFDRNCVACGLTILWPIRVLERGEDEDWHQW